MSRHWWHRLDAVRQTFANIMTAGGTSGCADGHAFWIVLCGVARGHHDRAIRTVDDLRGDAPLDEPFEPSARPRPHDDRAPSPNEAGK
jgi:hypothetical protein